MQAGDSVALRVDARWKGKIVSVAKGKDHDVAEVEFDGGGAGRISTADLVEDEEKTWPPTMETKVPKVETK